ncbi:MAG: CDF family Co(II)/Ni(II) efflux transporter DmeF [Hydrogenophaga sp.]|uniref:CDF family Co(II)/Ni(II) efflux transporter DmeF n=1 Tax=Hydrogenophaga sp. TaxID=1904254 RepID=UPI003D9AB7C9
MTDTTTAAPWAAHHHHFHQDNPAAERGTRAVLWITLAAMVLEITAGWWYGSMALLADGWHMSSHAVAIGVSALAYAAARRLAHDQRFAFGTWKIEVLGGFASALFLLGVAVLMVLASVDRFLDPQPIRYREAIAVAVLGLLVNLVCAFILGRSGDHGHDHGHGHGHGHHQGHAHDHEHGHAHEDLNLRAAYLHVLADAATSVLAIVALAGGWFWGWAWLDPLMGIVGAVLVATWAKGLIVDTSRVLLDREMDHPVVAEIREVVEGLAPAGSTRLTDLHVWRVGRGSYACALTAVSSASGLTPQAVREALAVHEEVVHATIELHHEAAR